MDKVKLEYMQGAELKEYVDRVVDLVMTGMQRNTRPVAVSTYNPTWAKDKTPKYVETLAGRFHTWGQHLDGDEACPVAVVEFPDGRVDFYRADLIRFTDVEACTNERDSWQCPNMRPVPGDLDMEYEHYECRRCGRKMTLDYEEMK